MIRLSIRLYPKLGLRKVHQVEGYRTLSSHMNLERGRVYNKTATLTGFVPLGRAYRTVRAAETEIKIQVRVHNEKFVSTDLTVDVLPDTSHERTTAQAQGGNSNDYSSPQRNLPVRDDGNAQAPQSGCWSSFWSGLKSFFCCCC